MISPSQIITAEQLIEKLAKKQLRNSQWIVKDELIIRNTTEFDKLHFKNITFKKAVKIGFSTIQFGVFFENCEFVEPVSIEQLVCDAYSHNENIDNCNVLFSSCKASYIHISNQSEFLRDIKFNNDCNIESLLITDTKVHRSGSIYVENSAITNIIDLSKVTSTFKIYSNIFNKLRVDSCNGNLSILNSTFNDWVQIYNLECPTSLVFNYNNFKDTVKIMGSRLAHMSVIGDIFQKKIKLENRNTSHSLSTHLKELYIREATFMEVGEFDGLGEQINQIKIPITPKLIGTLKIENWRVGELNIHGINQNLKLILSQLLVKRISMIGFTNYGDITFERCSADNTNFKTDLAPNSSMMLAHADFGRTKFIEFDFNSFDFIRVINSSFNEIYTSNVVWFDENKLQIEDDNQNEVKIAKRTREVYRQLKQSLKASGNQIDSLEFQAREMKSYRKELKFQGKDYKMSDRVIMSVNMSNDYGLSWLKPAVIILCITLIFYTFMLPLFSEDLNYTLAKNRGEINNTFSQWFNNFNVFWQLFNPVRKFSTVYGEIESSWLQFFDLIHRIILGILIYQIIKGFRRFASK
tara:strand:+ start:1702 stop:3441 length:1740 start_codon:yes stop_codon:yes gene_type:complete